MLHAKRAQRGRTQRHEFPSEYNETHETPKMQLSLENPQHMLIYMSTNNEIIVIRQYKHNEQEINSFAQISFSIYMNSVI